MKPQTLLRAVLWLVCLYSVGVGLLLNGPDSGAAFLAEALLDFDQAIEPPLRFAGRMLGAYMIFFGLAVGLAAWNPQKNRAVLTLVSLFLVIRILQRLVYATQLESAFGISPGKNGTYIAVMALLTVLLVSYRWLIHRERHPAVNP